MNQYPRLKDVDGAGLRPGVETGPIDALVRAAEVCQRDGLVLAPAHGEERGVALAHDALAEGVEAVDCRLLLGV